MTKKKSENLTKSEALALAWKLRKDYKGYDKSKGSSFNSWRSILYTEKANAAGFPLEWKSYAKFLSDVQGEWSVGKIVCRFDTKQPYSKDNSHWADKGFENSGKLIKIEYNGVIKTLMEWCHELKLPYAGVRQRYFKGKDYSVEEILFGKHKKVRNKVERDGEFRIRRMLGAYRLSDKNKGFENDLTMGYFKEEVLKGCVYCGDTEKIGFDRLCNKTGHLKSNVVPCCYDCNCARMDNFSHDEMKIIGLSIKAIKVTRNANKEI